MGQSSRFKLQDASQNYKKSPVVKEQHYSKKPWRADSEPPPTEAYPEKCVGYPSVTVLAFACGVGVPGIPVFAQCQWFTENLGQQPLRFE